MPKGYPILVVDDDEIMLRVAKRVLRNHWDIVTVGSVPGALSIMAPGAFSAVLTDWNMPSGGGRAVVDRARDLGIPSVAWSAGGTQPGMEKADAIIPKAFELVVIDRALWNVIKAG